jgi:hypothetical protein
VDLLHLLFEPNRYNLNVIPSSLNFRLINFDSDGVDGRNLSSGPRAAAVMKRAERHGRLAARPFLEIDASAVTHSGTRQW